MPSASHASAPLRRRQLTLFVPPPWGPRLDALRRVLDPVQAALIAAHVTLCREDEIAGETASALFSRLTAWADGPLRLAFGPPQRFQGHGLLLPCAQGAASFQQLRRLLLQDPAAREHGAHLTLAHPRNPQAAGNTPAALAACPQALALRLTRVALIEQQGAAPWTLIDEAAVGGSASDLA